MNLRLCICVAVAILQLIPSTYQQEDDLRLIEQDAYMDGRDAIAAFDSQKEDVVNEEGEPTKRIRARNGPKRRRRMRKRVRTTTEPPLEDVNENLNVAEQNADIAYEHSRVLEEASTALPPLEETTRKKQSKRRRRPHRKYQQEPQETQGNVEQENETPKPPRRRRKGGRRRMRPQIDTTEPSKLELYIETTAIPPEPTEMTTVFYIPENPTTYKPEQNVEDNYEAPIYQTINSRNQVAPPTPGFEESSNFVPQPTISLASHPSVQFVEQSNEPLKFPEIKIEDVNELLSSQSSRLKPYSAQPAVNTIKPVNEFIHESDSHEEPKEETTYKSTNEVPSQSPIETSGTQPDFGNKIFDRKSLFSKSRKLPETSAVIRKKLVPRQNIVKFEINTSRPNLSQYGEGEDIQKLLIPEGYTIQPQIVEPSKLIEKLKEHAKSYRTTTTTQPAITTTEEPNYPKFESKKEKFSPTDSTTTTEDTYKERYNKVLDRHRNRGKLLTVKEPENIPEETTTEDIDTTETTETETFAEEFTTEPPTTYTSENLNLNILNLNKLNDSIVELLQSESANMKLSEILESRNMTLAQLLEHREKGSSQFHLADIFAEKKSLIGENTTAVESMDDKEVITPLYTEKQTILFPNQDILGSFPSFISDKIEGGVQTSKEGIKEEVSSMKAIVQLENREPRVFDSMPEFPTKKHSEQPPWRVINPKLKPVSVRGDYEEIKISLNPSAGSKSNKDFSPSDDKADVLRTNRVSSTLEADSITSEDNNFTKFKRIPVTVKSAIIISIAILILAIFGFLSVLISCRLRQKKARLRAKQDILCEHLKNEDFMNSQQSLSPVLTKQQQRGPPVFTQNNIHSNTTSNRHYYLWRTLRKTFQYD